MAFPITGVPSSYSVPGAYAEIVFGQGPATASAGIREIVLVMPKTSAGTWTVNTLNRIDNEQSAKGGGGVGSPLHRAARRGLKCNNRAKWWAVPFAASSGTGIGTATATILIAGTASAAGTAEATVAGELCSVAYASGASAGGVAAALADVISARDWLPVTAAASGPTVTLTARIGGASQGNGTVGTVQVRAETKAGTTITATSSGELGSATAGADGATTEAANCTTALAALDAVRKYYMGISDWGATSTAALKTHLATKSDPIPGLRSVGCVGYTHTLAACQTLALAQNYERLQIVWQENSENTPEELVANMLAIRQKREEVDSAFNFDSYRAADWLVPAAYAVADWPTGTELSDAINDGITPIGSDANGSYVVYSATTRSKNAAGTVDDPRARETHRVSVADEFVDEMLSYYALNYSGKKLKSDETLADGTVNTNQKLPRNTVTPETFKPWIRQQLRKYGEAGKLQNVAASSTGLGCIRDPNNGGRLQVGLDLSAIDLLHQTTFLVSEVSSG